MISNSLNSYLLISSVLMAIGVTGVLTKRNLVAILISLELILNSASINFLAFNRFVLVDKSLGQVFTIFIVGLAAAEVTIGLSLILLLYRKSASVHVDESQNLKG